MLFLSLEMKELELNHVLGGPTKPEVSGTHTILWDTCSRKKGSDR